jgi:two-component system chemotaxis response regulator CheY
MEDRVATDLAKIQALIVDDNRTFMSILISMVKTIGFRSIATADNGKDALQLLQTAKMPFDLVVCDWEMPKASGLDLLKSMRAARLHAAFLMVTGRADPESVVLAKQHGVDGYIVKPFSPAQLEAKLRATLQSAASARGRAA